MDEPQRRVTVVGVHQRRRQLRTRERRSIQVGERRIGGRPIGGRGRQVTAQRGREAPPDRQTCPDSHLVHHDTATFLQGEAPQGRAARSPEKSPGSGQNSFYFLRDQRRRCRTFPRGLGDPPHRDEVRRSCPGRPPPVGRRRRCPAHAERPGSVGGEVADARGRLGEDDRLADHRARDGVEPAGQPVVIAEAEEQPDPRVEGDVRHVHPPAPAVGLVLGIADQRPLGVRQQRAEIAGGVRRRHFRAQRRRVTDHVERGDDQRHDADDRGRRAHVPVDAMVRGNEGQRC